MSEGGVSPEGANEAAGSKKPRLNSTFNVHMHEHTPNSNNHDIHPSPLKTCPNPAITPSKVVPAVPDKSGLSSTPVDPAAMGLQKEDINILYAFSGPLDREGSFAQFCQELQAQCRCMDKIIDKVEHNLLDERIIKQVVDDVGSGIYNGSLVSLMCGTFSGVRAVGNNSNPRPLRGPDGSELEKGFK